MMPRHIMAVSFRLLRIMQYSSTVSTPFKAIPVDPDKGTPIKNVQNYLDTFEHTWKEPGTYTVVFVGTCANYLGSSKQVKTLTVNILETVENPLD